MLDDRMARIVILTLVCVAAPGCGRRDGATPGQPAADSVPRATAAPVAGPATVEATVPAAREPQESGVISIVFSSDADGPLGEFIATLLITDGRGRRTGFDVASGDTLQEIPRSWYGDEVIEDPLEEGSGAATRTIEIRSPETGAYTLTIHATARGTYDLSIRGYNTRLEPTTRTFHGVAIESGEVHTYAIEFDPESRITVAAPRPIGER